MRFRAFTVTTEQFSSWIAHQQRPAVFNPTPAPTPPVAGTRTKTAARTPPTALTVQAAPVQAGFVAFDRARMPAHAVPRTPIPAALTFDTTIVGDAARGAALVASGSCVGCHTVKGVPSLQAKTGPDLTHVGSRLTIAGGLFPNDTRHLASWIKNSRAMKPGVQMPTQGKGQYDPILKTTLSFGYTDQQIADVVAYLQSLK
jgi:cytochrome c oxidase subunit 2